MAHKQNMGQESLSHGIVTSTYVTAPKYTSELLPSLRIQVRAKFAFCLVSQHPLLHYACTCTQNLLES